MEQRVDVTINGAHGRDFVYKTVVLKDNLGFAEQVTEENCKYVVRWKYDLGGGVITMPVNCILDFEGGSVENGRIESNGTVLKGVCKDSSNCLFGVFYDENGNILGWDKNKIEDWKTTTEYGNFRRDIEPGLDFGANQSMVVDEDYFYLLFSKDYTEDNVTLAYVTVVMYDRKFNYVGYSPLSRSSHANGATIYDGKIYIACSSRVQDSDSIHVLDIEELQENCIANKGLAYGDATVTDVEPIRLGWLPDSIDYDPITNTFAIGGGTYKIYDTELNLIKTSSISDYRDYGQAEFGRRTTVQDFAYKNGMLYALDWDYNYPNSDDTTNSSVMYVIDVATDKVINTQPVYYQINIAENEGLCKDPLTGDLYISCNNHGLYREDPIFSVYRLSYNNEKVGNSSKYSLGGDKWSNHGNGEIVFINNSYTGYSCGSRVYPYKSLGEAFVMAGGSNRIEFNLIYTGIPYYARYIRLSDIELRIYGNTVGPNGEKPEIDFQLRLRNSTLNLQRVKLNPSNKRGESLGTLYLEQHCNVILNAVDFVNAPGSTMTRNIRCDYHNYIYMIGCTFSDTRTENPGSHILLGYMGNRVDVVSATIHDGTFINPTSTGMFEKHDTSNCVHIFSMNHLIFEGDAILSSQASRSPHQIVLDEMITTLEKFEKVQTWFHSPNMERHLYAFAFSFYIGYTLDTDEGNRYKIGWYTNDYADEGGTTRYFPRSLSNSEVVDGVFMVPDSSRLPQNGFYNGRGLFSKADKKTAFWHDSGWKDAEGLPFVRDHFEPSGKNMIVSADNPRFRTTTSISTPPDGVWRVTGGSDPMYVPALETINVPYYSEIKKGFRFQPVASKSEIAYELSMTPGIYSVSGWFKGQGTVEIGIGYSQHGTWASVNLDSPDDFVFVNKYFTVTNNNINSGVAAVYIAGYGDAAVDIAVGGIKLEKGYKASALEFISRGDTASRPTCVEVGMQYFDTTLDELLVWNGTEWTEVVDMSDLETAIGNLEDRIELEETTRRNKNISQDLAIGALEDGLEDVYTKDETYNQEQVNNLISNTPETDVVVLSELPASGDANTLYRIPGPDNTSYSEYGWDGTDFKLLDVKDFGIDETPTEKSANMVTSDGIAQALKQVNSKSSGADFSVQDKKGYAVLDVAGGHVKTRNFDSSTITVAETDEEELAVGDGHGNNIVEFNEGHLKTKNFDSRDTIVLQSIVSDVTSVGNWSYNPNAGSKANIPTTFYDGGFTATKNAAAPGNNRIIDLSEVIFPAKIEFDWKVTNESTHNSLGLFSYDNADLTPYSLNNRIVNMSGTEGHAEAVLNDITKKYVGIYCNSLAVGETLTITNTVITSKAISGMGGGGNEYNDIYSAKVNEVSDKFYKYSEVGRIGYCFITDLHFNSNVDNNKSLLRQVQAMVDVANNCQMDFVCIGGDVVDGTNEASTPDNVMQNVRKMVHILSGCKCPVVILTGNHDDNAYNTGYTVDKGFYAKSMLVDNSLIPDMTFGGTDDDCYYYFEIPKKNLRVICLDYINYNKSAGKTGKTWWGFSQEEVEWLCGTALNTDKDIIILSHGQIVDIRYGWWDLEDEGPANWSAATSNKIIEGVAPDYGYVHAYQPGYTTDVKRAVAAFNNKTAITLYGHTYDFSSRAGRIILSHHGHMHFDMNFAIGNMPVLLTGCAKMETSDYAGYEVYGKEDTYMLPDATVATSFHANGYGYEFFKANTRTAGTLSEGLFDVVSVNSNAIHLMRIGAGKDRTINR